ncbi:hypothetical protein [Streptomyces sp. NPDC046984]|uniref:hypothetical protein n=1 Tax=unclassified Streptomyces TaxID=2593676 RepID=UPI0033F7B58D
MTLLLIVALALAGVGVYLAYQNPKLGAAMVVGLGILTALYLIWSKDPTVFPTSVPPTYSTSPAQTPPAGQASAPPRYEVNARP